MNEENFGIKRCLKCKEPLTNLQGKYWVHPEESSCSEIDGDGISVDISIDDDNLQGIWEKKHGIPDKTAEEHLATLYGEHEELWANFKKLELDSYKLKDETATWKNYSIFQFWKAKRRLKTTL